jgi:hypothetical protein
MSHTPISHQATFIKKKLLESIGGFKTEYRIIADWGVLIDSMHLNARFQKISLDICIAEKAGESDVSLKKINCERIHYLKKYHFRSFFINKYIVLPLINMKNKLTNEPFH